MTKIITVRQSSLGLQNQTDYISKDIHDISELGYFKKKQAKKAIRRLLSIAPHSMEEIADHFGISPELVEGLLMELTKADVVATVHGHSSKYYFKTKKVGWEAVHELLC